MFYPATGISVQRAPIVAEFPAGANTSDPAPTSMQQFAYSWTFFYAFAVISVALILLDSVCIVAMTRSTRTPFAARYLSIGLLLMDCIYMAVSCLYQIPFLSQGPIKHVMVELITVSSYQSYITVSMMSVERVILFKWPFWYIYHVTNTKLKRVALSIWIGFAVVYMLVRFPVCLAIYEEIDVMSCKNVYGIFLGVVTTVVVVTFIVCYTVIVRLIVTRKARLGFNKHLVGDEQVTCRMICLQFRTTSATLVYIIITVFVSIGLSVLAAFMPDMEETEIITSGHIVTLVSCVCNPIVYVIWFKDCQAELLKLIPFVNRRCEAKRQQKRMQIFRTLSPLTISSENRMALSVNTTENGRFKNGGKSLTIPVSKY